MTGKTTAKTVAAAVHNKNTRSRVSVACQTEEDPSCMTGLIPQMGNMKAHSPKTATSSSKPKTTTSEPTTSAQSTRTHTSSPSRSTEEGLLRVTIQNFSKMGDTLCSPTKRIKGVPWRIMVMPKQHMVMKKSQKCMGFFLQCCPDNTYNDQWCCQAVAEMRLIAQKENVQNFVRKTTHVYTAKENDWGYSCFMTWADVLDENQGYIKEDKVVLEIQVKAEAPKNMMSREEFIQVIDQWYKLAELQLSRGNIDLAIEANAQAIAYCRDKDKESLTRLKEQKDVLVKQKLVQSIKRLEDGDCDTAKQEELREKLSVRAAITGVRGEQKAVKRVTDKAHAAIKKTKQGTKVTTTQRKAVTQTQTQQTTTTTTVEKDTRTRTESEETENQRDDQTPTPEETEENQTLEERNVTRSQTGSESDDLDAFDYQEDLDLSVDSVDSLRTMDIFLPRRTMTQERDGSISSLEMANDNGENCSVETSDSGCQTEATLLPNPVRLPLPPHPIGTGAGTKRSSVSEQNSIVEQLRNSLSMRGQDSDSAWKQLSNSDWKVEQLEFKFEVDDKLKVEIPDRQALESCLKDIASFMDEGKKESNEQVIKLLTQLQESAGSPHGTEECIASVVASHVATLNCRKVIKQMEDFLCTAENLFKNESMTSTWHLLKKGLAAEMKELSRKKKSKTAVQAADGDAVDSSSTSSECDSEERDLGSLSAEMEIFSEGEEEEHQLHKLESGDAPRLTAAARGKNDVVGTMRTMATRELCNFNHSMGRAMDALQHLNCMVQTLNEGLVKYDTKKLASTLCGHRDIQAKLLSTEASLHEEKTVHNSTKRVLSELQNQVVDLKNQLAKKMKEKTNELKRLEKKSSKDDNRISELIAEKTDLEDKMKALRKELDAVKKSHTEETRKLKREKEKETETVKRMETEMTHREQERERELAKQETKVRQLQTELESRTKEVKAAETKERNTTALLQQTRTQAKEKIRTLEATVMERQLAGISALWERVHSDSAREALELEDLVEKCSSSGDTDLLARISQSASEWKAYAETSAAKLNALKEEWTPVIESTKKGEKPGTSVQASAPGPFPSTVRPSAAPAAPSPGVIGQARGNGTNTPSQNNSNNSFSRAPSPPAIEKNRMAPIGSRPTATVAPHTPQTYAVNGELPMGTSCGGPGPGRNGMSVFSEGQSMNQWSTWQSPLGGVLGGNDGVGGGRPLFGETPSWERYSQPPQQPNMQHQQPMPPSSMPSHSHPQHGPGQPTSQMPPVTGLQGYPQWANPQPHQQQAQVQTPPPGWPHQPPHTQQRGPAPNQPFFKGSFIH